MTAPPRPPLGRPAGPERIAELLNDAVRHVIAPTDALDRIRRGVRRRRAAHRAGTALLAAAVLAGGGVAALAVTSGRDPSKWDMDGDGRPDTAVIVPVGNAKTTSQFTLVVRMTRLGTRTVPFTATSQTAMPPHGPVLVGAADAAHDGHAELFVQVDAGCCTEYWAIFRLASRRVRQMTVSGVPVAFAVGGSALDNGGFSCAGPDLVVSFYRERSGGPASYTFQATRQTYRWAGARLILVSRQTTTIRGAPADPALAHYRGVSCGSLPQYEPVR